MEPRLTQPLETPDPEVTPKARRRSFSAGYKLDILRQCLKGLVLTSIFLLAALAFGRFFISQITTENSVSGPPGVILAAPPEVRIEDLGEVTRAEGALRLSQLFGPSGEKADVRVHFSTVDGREFFWYAEKECSRMWQWASQPPERLAVACRPSAATWPSRPVSSNRAANRETLKL